MWAKSVTPGLRLVALAAIKSKGEPTRLLANKVRFTKIATDSLKYANYPVDGV